MEVHAAMTEIPTHANVPKDGLVKTARKVSIIDFEKLFLGIKYYFRRDYELIYL